MSQFARMSHPLIQKLQELPPCARLLHEYLLASRPAGRPQEVFLEEFAELCDCGIKYLRRCLKLLIEKELVDLVRRYSASVFRLVAHDERTFDFATGKKSVQNDDKSFQNGHFCVQKEDSKPDSIVTNNREIFRDNRDTRPLHPVKGNETEPKRDLVTSETSESKAVSEPLLSSVHAELREVLQQPLNKNILAVLLDYPDMRARDALDALREAIAKGNVKNPSGWFVQALRKGYKPNHTRSSSSGDAVAELSQPELPEDFSVWYELAFKAGIALASEQQDDGEIIIHGPDCAEPYEQVKQTWPVEKLREMVEMPSRAVSPTVKRAEPVVPVPAAEVVEDEGQRRNALARLKAKFELPLLKEGAIAEAKLWGFDATRAGIFEVAF